VNCCSVFPLDFFYDFFQNYPYRFFFNIELVKNYNYNKTKSYEESVVVFLTKHYGLLQYFSKWFFYDFFKNCLCRFYWGKHCSFPHKILSIATTFFLIGVFSFQNYLCRFCLILSWWRI
jgi:hypothetical protein